LDLNLTGVRELSGAEEHEMSMPNQHRAEHTDRPASLNHNSGSVISFWDAPTDDLDMFTRWIKLSDDALDAHRGARKKAANHRRRRPVAFGCNVFKAGVIGTAAPTQERCR
jgi:hypothetical protein